MYTTAEVAERIGVSKNTLLRWIGEGRLADVTRDWRNWRVWSDADLTRARAVRDEIHGQPASPPPVVLAETPAKGTGLVTYAGDLTRLGQGRRHRQFEETIARTPKALGVPVYSSDLLRLGEGRSHRAEQHP